MDGWDGFGAGYCPVLQWRKLEGHLVFEDVTSVRQPQRAARPRLRQITSIQDELAIDHDIVDTSPILIRGYPRPPILNGSRVKDHNIRLDSYFQATPIGKPEKACHPTSQFCNCCG